MDYRGKRTFDLVLTLIAAPVWILLLGCVALAVRVSIGKPIFFRQARPGKNERIFQLLKFRTMDDRRDPDGNLLPDADRLTKVGRWLRSSSLDELPEFLNVLRGEMSLVGPRPLLPEYLSLYSPEQRLRHCVSPGLTGLAQVSGRNAISWEQRLRLDVAYVRSASLRQDISILSQTIVALITRRGVSAPNHATMPAFTGPDAGVPRATSQRRSEIDSGPLPASDEY